MKLSFALISAIAASLVAADHKIDKYVLDPHVEFEGEPSREDLWGTDWPFAGVNTFAHLPHTKCLLNPDEQFDIALIGMPFDTAVSYRSGARFGPRGIRAASQRQTALRGYNVRADLNPYDDWAKIIDCGDMPISPMDNNLALKQMTMGYQHLLNHTTPDTKHLPRLVSLGGDHSIILPALRALYEKYGKITLIHFDAHLDTWLPNKYPSHWPSDQAAFTHGSMLWIAYEEGLLQNNTNIHAGLRTRLSDAGDYEDDDAQGFARVHSDDIMTMGIDGIVDKIKRRIPKDEPVYLSIDIDVIDPGLAPGTGTPEVGGFLTRELISMLRKLEDLNLVGADIVEVNPSYDHAETTTLAAAQIAFEIITNMVKRGPLEIDEDTGRIINVIQDSIIEESVENIAGKTGQALPDITAKAESLRDKIKLQLGWSA
ncbi:CYFA0S12e04126g1_1 [Cyberlindnera fabianii]|uniref:CYFA0S12e04126g1_1 n=1 Tax=Cyberlindnera fabianii TaxID=36022 RepID=A0A061B7C1_CYBFA|nr:Guanidinobutyrase [Cyberlindnera fabianii]CDR43768.1 CYFA0S12e04126g1_1 [Cyberlindnera fabianii]